MSCLTDADEYFHSPSHRPDWRESYYFNFVDLDNGVSGFTTIGLLPNLGKREFVFILFHPDGREVYYVEPEGPVTHDSLNSLSNGRLEYALVDPLKEWTIKFAGERLTADLRWKARFPPCDFGGGSETSWSGHFEQSGHVSGTVGLSGGHCIVVKGLGQRDKSWGPRDWHIESWYALHAQFDSYSIALRRDVVKDAAHVAGAISTPDGHVAISKVDLETEFTGGKGRMPTGATTCIHGADGTCYTLRSSLISPASFFRFSRRFPGGTTDLFEDMAVHECVESGERATGLTEWLFTQRSPSI